MSIGRYCRKPARDRQAAEHRILANRRDGATRLAGEGALPCRGRGV